MFIEMTRVDEITDARAVRRSTPRSSRRAPAKRSSAPPAPATSRRWGSRCCRGRLFDETDGPGRPHVAVDQQEPGREAVARPRSARPLHPVRQHGRRPHRPARRRRRRRRARAVAGVAARADDLRQRAAAAGARRRVLGDRARTRPARSAEPVRPDHARRAPDSPYELSTVSAGLDSRRRLAPLQPVADRRVRGGGAGAGDARRLRPRRLRRLAAVARDGHPRRARRRAGVARAAGAERARPGSRSSARVAGLVLALLASAPSPACSSASPRSTPACSLTVAAIMLAAAMAASYLPARRILKQAPGLGRCATSDRSGRVAQSRNFPISHLWPDGSIDRALQHARGSGAARASRACAPAPDPSRWRRRRRRAAARRSDRRRTARSAPSCSRPTAGPRVPCRRRLRRQEERRAVDVEPGDDVAVAQPPRDGRPERGLVEGDRRVGVADREHRRDAGGHARALLERAAAQDVIDGRLRHDERGLRRVAHVDVAHADRAGVEAVARSCAAPARRSRCRRRSRASGSSGRR